MNLNIKYYCLTDFIENFTGASGQVQRTGKRGFIQFRKVRAAEILLERHARTRKLGEVGINHKSNNSFLSAFRRNVIIFQ